MEKIKKTMEANWISVKDNEPKHGGCYLIYNPNAPTIERREVAHYDRYNDMWHTTSGDGVHPSHYMPLPAPPLTNH